MSVLALAQSGVMDEIGEAELAEAWQHGAIVDGAAGGHKRSVPAELLREWCYRRMDQIDPRGLRLSNTVVAGELDLTGLVVPFSVRFEGCEFDAPPLVEGAQLFELSLTGSPRLPGLLGNGLRLRRDLDLSRSHINGAHWTSGSTSKQSAVWLCESEIGGRLLCVDTIIDGQGGRAIQADRIRVGGAVRLLHKFSSRGEVRLIGARINGSLDITGASLTAVDGPAIELEDAVIEGSMFVIDAPDGRRPEIHGRIGMGSTRISGRMEIRNAIIEAYADPQRESIYARPAMAGLALDAAQLSVAADVAFVGRCDVTGSIDMTNGDMSSVSIGAGCVLHAPHRTALDLTNGEIRAHLRLEHGATVEGTIRLEGTAIHGMLALNGRMSKPEHRSLVGGSAITVDGSVYLDGLQTKGGRINFRGATLAGLMADGAQLDNPDGYSISLKEATVKGSVQLADGFSSTGLVVLSRSTIEGILQFNGGTFTCPAPEPRHNQYGHAIEAISANVHGGLDLGWDKVWPSVDFTDVTTTFMADDPATWPPQFIISGLSYERFERPQGGRPREIWDQRERCGWLERQTDFDSGAYEQAARVFRQHGRVSEAEEILMAQRRHATRVDRPHPLSPRRILDPVYALVGYGYRPTRVLWALAILLVAVLVTLELPASQATLRATNGSGAVYSIDGQVVGPGQPVSRGAHADVCGDGEVRCFSPVLYTIDTVVPLISLDQRSTWYPDPHTPDGEFLLLWLNIATLLGWMLSSVFVLSLARLSRST
jgi:hypothetical protein